MKLVAIAASAMALASVGQAVAADLPRKSAPPALVAVAPFNWTGFRVGLQGGWAGAGDDRLGLFSNTAIGSSRNLGQLAPNGGYIGLNVGYDHQFAGTAFVAGIMADIDLPFMERSRQGTRGALAYYGKSEVEWTASIRGRLGYSFGRVLVYGTGGVAFAQSDYTVRTTAPVVSRISSNTNHVGYTVGGGLEYAITNNLILGAEYRWTQFELKGLRNTTALGGASFVRTNATPNWHRLGATISYKF
jgi:outer membrane immunogenic protein